MEPFIVFLCVVGFGAMGLHYVYLVGVMPLVARLAAQERELFEIRKLAATAVKDLNALAKEVQERQWAANLEDEFSRPADVLAFGGADVDNSLRGIVDGSPDLDDTGWDDIEALRANVRQKRADAMEPGSPVHGKKLRRVQP